MVYTDRGNSSFESRGHKKSAVMLIMFICIYLSDALLFTYNSSTLLSTTIPQYGLVLLALSFLGMDLHKRKFVINMRFAAMLLICGLLVAESIIHGELRGGYISKISLFILGYCLFDYFPQEDLIRAYKKWMDIICVASLVGLVFGRVIVSFGFFPSITSILGRRYIFLLLTNVPVHDMIRNYGPFTEPSRFQAFICLALIFELFNHEIDERLNWKRVVLYLVTIVTTFSATAYIAVAFILIAYLTSSEVSLGIGNRTALIIVLVAAVALLVNFSSGVNIAVTKLQLGERSESFTVRVNSIIGGLRVALNNPIFGTGFGNYQSEYMNAISDLAVSRSHVSTNTMILYFSKFGVIIGLYYAVNVFTMLKSFTKTYTAMMLFLGFFFSASGISLVDSIIFTSIIFYRGFNDKKVFASQTAMPSEEMMATRRRVYEMQRRPK